ncbi:DUF535 family protein [Enterobacteriaceae bacterium ESL0689]|nr:DUF535 family protein [Enterobacteriaceae bacterium ESL0689]
MTQTAIKTFKAWRKNNKYIIQAKSAYKKVLRKCREIPLKGKKYKEYQMLCESYLCARLTAATEGLDRFQDKPFIPYLNKTISKKTKLDIAYGALQFLEKRFSAPVLQQLFNMKQYGVNIADIPLKNGTDIEIRLLASPFQQEGELMLLMRHDKKRVYSICFSCTEDHHAYIGGLQRGKDITNDDIKVLTKELQGARPKNLLLSLLYAFLQYADINEIYAIDSDHHIKSEKVKTSYAGLWLEVGGEKYRNGWYKLPPQERKKNIEEVKSKHRSQFLRREAMKEQARTALIVTMQKIMTKSASQ